MHQKEIVVNRTIRSARAVTGATTLLAMLALSLGLGGGAHAQEADGTSLQLTASRDSGVSGTATITSVDGGVKVEINMRGLPKAGVEHINHFHAGGSCEADRAGNVAPATIPLETIVAEEDGTGSGTTTLDDVTLDALFDTSKERYIALHSQVEEGEGVPPVISCADVTVATGSGSTSATLPDSGGLQLKIMIGVIGVLSICAALGVGRSRRRLYDRP